MELINGQGADKVMTAVLAGQVDIGFSGPEAVMMAGVFTGGSGDYVTLFEPVASTLEREGKGYILARE